MKYEAMKKLKKILPSNLMERAISLENIGISEYVWTKQDAISVITILGTNKTPVLGGDVYLLVGEKISNTRDNWYVDIKQYEHDESLIRKSVEKSIEYITSYSIRNGENFYYSIIFI